MMKVKNRFADYDLVITVTDDTRVKYKDVFDMKQMYADMHDWLVEQEWTSSKDSDFKEIFYHHRWTQTGGEEVRFWWRMEKIPTQNKFYKWELDINVLTVNLKRTEVVIDGKKFKAFTGEPEIKIFARMIADYEHKWKNHWFLKHVRTLFFKRIFYKNMEMHRIELYREVYRFTEFMKTHFKLIRYRPEPEGEQFFTNKDFE
ncbi:MAG: hypothetical protein V1837_02215 [Candidatus Woesearchaeota archaeon]